MQGVPGNKRLVLELPGEIELETEARYREEGIPMLTTVIESLEQLAQGLGLSERVSTGGREHPLDTGVE